jgi:hypothetical protein
VLVRAIALLLLATTACSSDGGPGPGTDGGGTGSDSSFRMVVEVRELDGAWTTASENLVDVPEGTPGSSTQLGLFFRGCRQRGRFELGSGDPVIDFVSVPGFQYYD